MKRLYYLIIIALTFLIAIPNVVKASCTDGNPNDNCNGYGTCYNVGPGDPLINVSIDSNGVCLSLVGSQQGNCSNIGSFDLLDINGNGVYDVYNPVTNWMITGFSGAKYPPGVYMFEVYNPALWGASTGTGGSLLFRSDNSNTYSAAVGVACYEPTAPGQGSYTSWSYWNNNNGQSGVRMIDWNYTHAKGSLYLANCSSASYVGTGGDILANGYNYSSAGFWGWISAGYNYYYSATLSNNCTWNDWFDFNIQNTTGAPQFFFASGGDNFYIGMTMIPVILSSFSATSGNNHITIQWQTSQENSNAGFYIYRSTDNVHYAKVNTTIIAPNQHNYTYTDTNVVNGTKYYYKLEDVSLSGAATMHNTIAWAIPSPANLDGSGVVDGNDLIILSQAMGSKPGMSNWNPKADLNGDGVVDEKDLQILQQYFGDQLSGVADSNANTSLQSAQYENNMLNSVSLLPIANTNISAPPTVAIPQQHQINH